MRGSRTRVFYTPAPHVERLEEERHAPRLIEAHAGLAAGKHRAAARAVRGERRAAFGRRARTSRRRGHRARRDVHRAHGVVAPVRDVQRRLRIIERYEARRVERGV